MQLHTDPAGEVARLQQMVSELQRQLHQGLTVPPTVPRRRVRKREEYVPATEHEVMGWMSDRQEEMNAALVSGNPREAARISGLITDATKSLLPTPVPASMDQHVVRLFANEDIRCTGTEGSVSGRRRTLPPIQGVKCRNLPAKRARSHVVG